MKKMQRIWPGFFRYCERCTKQLTIIAGERGYRNQITSPFSLLLLSTRVGGSFTGRIPPSSGHSDSSHRHGEKQRWLGDAQDSCPGYSPCASATRLCSAHLLCVLYNCVTRPPFLWLPVGFSHGSPWQEIPAWHVCSVLHLTLSRLLTLSLLLLSCALASHILLWPCLLWEVPGPLIQLTQTPATFLPLAL